MNLPFRHLAPTALLAAALPLVSCSLHAQTANPNESTATSLAKLDADMLQVVTTWDAVKGTHIEQLTPQDARQQVAIQDVAKFLSRAEGTAEQPTAVGRVVDGLTVPGEGGVQIPIRIYVPPTQGVHPVVVYYHGGGFVIATIDTYDESARNLCVDANAIVVSVEYRKAPEAPFPAAYDDAIDSYRWVTQNIAAYGGNASQVAVAGESAGGNLAAEVAIAGTAGTVQKPVSQLLIYPITTSNLNQASDLEYTSSALPLYLAELPYFNAQYVQSPTDPNDPRVTPINANLANLPPAIIIAAEVDPLLSDGQDYYAALVKAKDTATYRRFNGVTHEFFGLGAVVKKAKAAEQYAGTQLDSYFSVAQ